MATPHFPRLLAHQDEATGSRALIELNWERKAVIGTAGGAVPPPPRGWESIGTGGGIGMVPHHPVVPVPPMPCCSVPRSRAEQGMRRYGAACDVMFRYVAYHLFTTARYC